MTSGCQVYTHDIISAYLTYVSLWLIMSTCAKTLRNIEPTTRPLNSRSHVATIFCNHLAKLLQKIVVSKKTNTSSRRQLELVPFFDSLHFDKISNWIRDWHFVEMFEMSAWLGQRYHYLMKSRYCSRKLSNR